ncbi:MAG: hypothetical protein QGG40_17150, partial [Myxococcota bacterium]|nr:hypothetical protein [Myxococcota bacterium]
PLETLSPTTGDPTLGRMHSNQAALGLDLLLAQRWELGAEAWGRSLRDSVVTDVGVAPEAVDGWASGLEFTSRYRLREVFFSWVSLTVARAEREDAPFDYDQPYAFNFVASYDPRPGWNVGFRFRAASGLPYTPVASSIYDGTTDSYTAVPGEVNSARLPDYKKVDIHLERAVSFPRWTLSMYSETWWVLPGGNVLYPAYSFDYSEQGFVAGPSFLPLVGLRAEL